MHEKYAVEIEVPELIKSAQEGIKCKCGGEIKKRGNVFMCSEGGTSCLEKS